jgi:hypothetical protein
MKKTKSLIKKDKLPAKICCLCGEDTSDYIIKDNSAICKNCQKDVKQ